MSEKDQTKPEKQPEAAAAETPEAELTEEQLDEVAGGVAFLKGTIVAETDATAQVAVAGGGANKLAAKSATTLECWEKCTVFTSAC